MVATGAGSLGTCECAILSSAHSGARADLHCPHVPNGSARFTPFLRTCQTINEQPNSAPYSDCARTREMKARGSRGRSSTAARTRGPERQLGTAVAAPPSHERHINMCPAVAHLKESRQSGRHVVLK